MDIRDIASYLTWSFNNDDILNVGWPDAVVLLTVETFARRDPNWFCRGKRIPTVDLYHGLAGTFRSKTRNQKLCCERWAYLRVVIRRVGKIMRYTSCHFPPLRRTWLVLSS